MKKIIIHKEQYPKVTESLFNLINLKKNMIKDLNNNNNISEQEDSKSSLKLIKEEEEKKKKMLVEEKQHEDQLLPVGEGHETEVIEENKD